MTHATDLKTSHRTLANRLATEKSPYLLQHAANPVDWYPWCDEAFAAARRDDKPIFLSIGYATCHWCHVMERESFEDPLVASLMNDAFINIKVDREERPDIDQVYMSVCQMLTARGGWPLTIIMTPDKQPFFAATYLPKSSVYGRTGLLDLIPKAQALWQHERDAAVDAAQRILADLAQTEKRGHPDTLDRTVVDVAFRQLSARYDRRHGGFGDAPKFPTPHNLIFLLRYWHETGNDEALEMATTTLLQMRMGGVYDQIGFGMHRYSTDREWLVPHFEKMLYDQAMVMLACTEAWSATQNVVFRTTVHEIAEYVLRDMTSPEGAFFSAEDADSEGEEGRFYLWTADEVAAVVGTDQEAFASDLWNLHRQGNFRDEATGARSGRNIPHLTVRGTELARLLGGTETSQFEKLDRVRRRLFAARKERVHPLKDDKILADWSSLMAAALASAGRTFENQTWIRAAARAVSFVDTVLRSDQERLLHRYRDGEAAIPAFLDDHVFLTTALIELYGATLEPRFLARALALHRETSDRFWDAQGPGGFFFTADDNEELLVRDKEVYDGAIPSGNSMAADNAMRLARLTGDSELERQANLVLAAFAADATRHPSAHCQLLGALLRGAASSLEIVIAGDPGDSATRALLGAVRQHYLPHAAVLLIAPGPPGDVVRGLAPFTKDQLPVEGCPAAYVCSDFACNLPVTDPSELAAMIEGAISRR